MGIIAPNQELYVPTEGGVSICCRCYGQGEKTVVLLHGNGEDYRCFKQQLEPFSKRFRVIAIDSRGHGSSSMGFPFSLQVMAKDTKQVLEALSIEKANIIGFSDGANIAMYFAMEFPDCVEKLVLAGGNLFPEGLIPKERRKDKIIYRFLRMCSIFSKEMARKAKVYGLMVEEPQIDPARLEVITSPTLILAGEHDLIMPEHTQLIAAAIHNSLLRIIPSCDHFIFQNKPGWVNTTILKFLG